MLFALAPFPPLQAAMLVFLAGLCLGSFASAMAYRLPRDIRIAGASRSACPACTHPLGFFDLIPLFSWLFLKGRCRYCRAAIGWQYPVIECATALLCLGLYLRFGFSAETIPLLLMAPVMIAIIDIDFRHKIIPDGLNLSVFLLGFASLSLVSFLQHDDFGVYLPLLADHLLAAFLYGFGFYLLRRMMMALLKKDPMGWGDIKFVAAAGIWLGLRLEVLSAFLLISGVSGIGLALLWRRQTGEAEFPFGPSLLLAFIAVLLWQGPGFYG